MLDNFTVPSWQQTPPGEESAHLGEATKVFPPKKALLYFSM